MKIYCKLFTSLFVEPCGANFYRHCSKFSRFPCQKCAFNRTIKCCFFGTIDWCQPALTFILRSLAFIRCLATRQNRKNSKTSKTRRILFMKSFRGKWIQNTSRVKGPINLQLDINKKSLSKSWEISSLAIIKSTTADSWQIHYKMINDFMPSTSRERQHSCKFLSWKCCIGHHIITYQQHYQDWFITKIVEFPDRIFHSQQRIEVDKFHL